MSIFGFLRFWGSRKGPQSVYLTPPEATVLRAFDNANRAALSELSMFSRLVPSEVSVVLLQLREKRLIHKIPDDLCELICLTKAGEQVRRSFSEKRKSGLPVVIIVPSLENV